MREAKLAQVLDILIKYDKALANVLSANVELNKANLQQIKEDLKAKNTKNAKILSQKEAELNRLYGFDRCAEIASVTNM